MRIELLNALAGTGEMLVATHLPFPSVGRVSREGEAFRWVSVLWDSGSSFLDVMSPMVPDKGAK